MIPKSNGSLEAVNYNLNDWGLILASDSVPEIAPDVAYDDEANAYLVIWEYEPNSAPDKIQARIVNPNGSEPGDIADIVANIFDAEKP